VRLAYMVSGFPMLSETFVIREILEMQRAGHDVQVYSLKNLHEAGYDQAADSVVRTTQYSPSLLSADLLWTNLKVAICHPVKYWGVLVYVLLHSLGQPKECVKALGIYPKTVYYGALMARRGVGHIHVHFANVPTLSALVIHRLWGIPYSFTAHAHDLFNLRSMLAEKLHEASFAVTISEFNRSFMATHCATKDMEKLHVLHCGADIRKLADVPRRPEPGLVVSVARLTSMKGLVHLVEACDRLRRRGVAVRCHILGEGEDRSALEQHIRRLDLQDIVSLPGAVLAEEVAPLVSTAAVFVLPSVRAPGGSMDGIPVSLMEAMALRVPVVSTRVSGIPELVRDGETGLLVEPRDTVGLSDAIERLITHPDEAARLAENGFRLVCEEFDLHKNARRLEELFRSHS
jgi:colanic acid/amylovoran biosynthesis glycosyltransferase